jgi:hypothetical protein
MSSLILPQSFESVMLMFVLVDAVDFVVTFALVRTLLKRLFPVSTV